MNAAPKFETPELDLFTQPALVILKPDEASKGLQTPSAAPDPETPLEIVHYGELWTSYAKLFADFSAQIEQLRQREKLLMAPESKQKWEYSGYISSADDKEYTRLHSNLVHLICSKAERAFAVPGSHLKISPEDYAELPQARIESFDPVGLWKYLKAHFDNEEGQSASYQNAAKELQHAKELSPWQRNKEEKDAKVVGGRLVLSISLYGEWEYNFSSRESIGKFIGALKCVAIWGQVWDKDDEEAVDSLVYRIQNTRGKDARILGKIEFWKLCHVVSYKEKLEFRLHPSLAEQVQVFMATYSERRD